MLLLENCTSVLTNQTYGPDGEAYWQCDTWGPLLTTSPSSGTNIRDQGQMQWLCTTEQGELPSLLCLWPSWTSSHRLSAKENVGKRDEVTGEGQPVTVTAEEPPAPASHSNTASPKTTNTQCQPQPKKRLAQLIGKRCMVSRAIDGVPFQMLLDSGAQVTMVGRAWMEKVLP